jgi:hypothetical protein
MIEEIKDFLKEVYKHTSKHKDDILKSGNLQYDMSNELVRKIKYFNLYYNSLDKEKKNELINLSKSISRDLKLEELGI